ncbi:MAG: phage virion morphogenesis protein [Bacteroidales bacterium]|nr:phage virion morphogenesis protein [Bacteroidales bacterium]
MSRNTKKFLHDLRGLANALQGIVNDVAVISADAFDRNFEKESFFGKPWKPSKYVEQENAKRKKSRHILQNRGHLRKSINYGTFGNTIRFYSNLPYANIHNEGGTIKHPGGTAYFYDKKKGKPVWISNRTAYGKNYARTKAHKIEIPQRQFIGDHKLLEKMIEEHIEKEIMKHFF